MLSSKVRMICLLLAVFLGLAGTVSALTYNVTSTTDFAYTTINNNTGVITAGAGVGQVTLRSAIQGADALGGTHTINVPAGTYNLVRGSIIFGNGAQNITITGAGAATTVINMTTTLQDRIFFINPPGTIANVSTTLQGLRFTGGRLTSDIYGGGAILAGGPTNALTITNCTFDNNTIAAAAGTTGGAINMSGGGALTIDQSTFSSNSNPVSDGGAVYYFLQNFANLTGSMTITNSTFTNNTVTAASSNGGAIGFAAQGAAAGQSFSVSIQRNTFTGNSAPSGTGGAIHANNSFGAAGVINILYNRIVGNTAGNVNTSGLAMASSAGSVTATNNWWGCNTGPGTAACNRAAVVGSGGAGTLNVSTWLQLRHTASPISICPTAFGPGNTSTLTASFLTNSAGTAVAASNLTALVGLPLTFNGAVLGTISAAQTTLQADGTATATFTSNGTPGTASANVVFVPLLENVTVTTSPTITVNAAPAVTTHPANVSLCGSGSATFSVVATGAGLSYQWQENTGSGFINASGASTGTSYTVNPATAAMNGYQYRVVITGTCGVATSNNATLTVTNPPVVTAPTVTQPTCTTPTATIVVNATGSGTLEYSINNGTSYQASATFTGVAPSSSNNIRVRLQGNPTCFTNYASNPVVINAVPTAPTVNNPATATGTVGTAFSQTFTATGGLAPITFSTTSTLPTGLALSTAGVLSGIPTQSGTFPIVVRATDANGCIGTGATYNLVISCQTITVTNPATTTGTVGTAFSQTFTQTGGLGAITFSTTSTLPTGLTLSVAGVLSGTPTQSGTFPIVVRATDVNGCFGNGPTYTLVISCQTITVTNPAVTTGQLNIPFSQTFTQTGGIGTITFSTTSTLPTGLTLSSAGVLSGTPTQTGTFPIVVRATDANGCFGNGPTYTLVIVACPVVDQTVTAAPTSVCTGTPSTITVGASQPGVNYTLRTSPANTVVAGPTASNGPAINFSTGNLTANTTFNVLAETDNYSVYLDGSQAGFTIPHAASIDLTNDFTVEGWIRPDGNSGFARLYNKDGSFALGISSNQNQITFTRHGIGDYSSAYTFVSGQWYHIACTYSSSTVNFFVNGTPVGTTVAPLVNASTQAAHIGSDAGGNFNQFKGNIDNVRLWSSVRTPAQIAANQSAFLTSTGNPTLAASWWIIEGSGNAKDYSANGNNATAFAGTWQNVSPVAPCSIVLTNTPTVTVIQNNTITLTSAAGTNAQNVCINTPITNITYATTSATGATFSGLPAGVNGAWAANVVTISGTPTVAGNFNYTVTLTGGCGPVTTATGSINVAANNTITLTSAAGTNAQNVCINTPITNITYSTTGATGASFSGLPAGVTGAWAANVVTISGTPTASGTFNYTVTLTGGCGTVTATGSINVITSNTITLTSAFGTDNQTVCNNSPITNITYATTGATGASFSGLPAGVTGAWAANVVTISGTPTAAGTFNYTVTLTGGCGTVTATGSILVGEIPTVNTVSNQTVCNGSATTAVNFTGTPAGVIFNWTNSTPSIGLAASGTGNIPSFTATNATAAPVTATVTVTPVTSYPGGAAASTTLNYNGAMQTFTVPAGVTSIEIETWGAQGANGSQGGSVTCPGGTGGRGGYAKGTLAVTPGQVLNIFVGGAASGGNGGFNGGGTTATTGAARAGGGGGATDVRAGGTALANRVIVAAGGGGGGNGGTRVSQAITSIPGGNGGDANAGNGTAGTNSGGGSGGSGGTGTTGGTLGAGCSGFSATNGGTGTLGTGGAGGNGANCCSSVYGHGGAGGGGFNGGGGGGGCGVGTPGCQFNDNGAGGGGAAGTSYIGGVTAGTVTNAVQTGNGMVKLTYQGSVTCTGTPITFTYTVNPTPTVNVVSNQTVCNGAATTAVTFTGATTGTVYNWTNNTTSIGLAASGTGNIASFTATNATAAAVTATITVTPSYTNGGVTCTGTPRTFTITVNPTPTVNNVPDQVVCNGGATTAITFSGATAGTVYNWTNNTPSIGLAASGTGNIASFTATNATGAPVTGMVTVTPSYTNGAVTCTGTPITFAITVNPSATVNTVANQTVCNNTLTTAVTFSSPTLGGTIVYNWTNNTPSIGLAASGTGNIAAFTATNATGAPVTATITVTPAYTNSITCNGTPMTFTITVNPTATVNPVANQVVCNTQSTTAITFSSPTTGGTIVYNWTNNTPSIGLAASGTGNIAAFTAVNTGTAAVVATITVTPAYTNGSVTCNGTPITFTITVNPPPAVTCPGNINVNAAAGSCSAVVTYTTSNTGGGTITYAFTGATTATGAGDGSGSTFNVGVTTVTVTTTSSCGSSSCTFTVTVNDTQAPVITCPAQIVVCGSQVVNYPLPTVTDNCTVATSLNLTQTASNTITPSNSVSCNNGAGHTANSYWRVYDLAALGLTGPYTVNRVIFGIESANAPSGSQPATIRLHTLTGAFTIVNLTQVASQGITIPNQSGTLFTVNLAVPPTVPANAKLVVEVFTPDGRPTSTLFYLGSNTGAQTAPNYISAPDCGVVNPIDVSSVGYPNMHSVLNVEGTVGGGITPVQTAGLPSGSVFPVGTTVNTYTATDASGNSSSCSFNVIVNPIPTVNAVSNQSVCNGDATTAVTFTGAVAGTVYNWTNNTPSIGLAASGTGNIASFTAVNLTSAAVTATITVTPSYTANGTTCTGTPTTFTITVNPRPTVDPVANQVVCNGAPTTAVNFTGATAGTVYNWTNNTPSIGLAASGTGNIASFNAINTGTAPVVATITVTPTITGGVTCPGTPITFTITVNPTPVVNTVANQVVCNGAPTTVVTFSSPSTGGTIVYNWTNNTPSIGLAASGAGNIASFNAINTGTAPVAATITVTPSYTNAGTTCTGAPITFTITVNPTPTVNAVANQVVCNGAPTTAVTFAGTVPGTVYNWTNNTTSIGLAASGTGNIASFTATNTTNAPVVATITVTPSYTNGGTTCTGTPRTFTITVNPTPTVNAVANQVTCHGALTTAVNFTGFVPGTVYNWTNNTTSIGLAASGTGNIPAFTATNTTLAPVVATITVTPSYTNGGTTCTGSPITFTITVNPTPTINPVPSQTVCNGAPTTPVVFTGNLTGTLCATANENSNAVLTAPAGTVITGIVFASYGNPNGSCGAYTLGSCHATNSMSIVSSLAIGQTTVSIPANNGLFGDPCNGTAKRLYIQFTYGAPGASYSWTNNTPSIGLAASGTGSIIPSFNPVNTGNAPVVATVTVTPTFTNGASGCSGTPTTFTITVNPTPIVNTVANQVVCNGAPTTAVTFTSPSTGGTIVYNWTNNNSTIGLAASGTGNIASFNAINTGAVPVTATISVTASYTNNGVTCTGAPVTFTITVNPTPSVNAVANQVVCNGAPTTAVNFTTPVPGTVFNWTNNTPSIGLAASGTGNIASFNAINTTNAPVVATITVTPTFTNGGVTCTGTSRTFTITVNPTPTVNAVTSQVVCNGAPTTAVTFSGFVPGTVYNWTNTTTSIGLAASGTGNIASFNAINTGTTPVIATITVTPTYTNGGVTCTGTPTTFTITVNPTPVVDPVANETVCNNSPTTTVVFSSTATGGTIVYNWTNNNTSIGLGASGTGDIPSFIGTNATNAPVTATITVTASYTNGGVTCTGPARTFTITVNPTPTADPVASQVVCNNAPTTAINFTSPVAGTTFNWANNVPSIGLASSGTGNIASFTAINNGTTPVVATIVVTPIFTNNGVSCAGPDISFTITVNPTPNVDAVNNQSVCNGSATAAITFTGAVPGTVYNWTNNTTSIGLAASGTGNIASFTATNATTAPVTATITVTPSYTNGGTTCSGTPITFTITVNPTPTVAAVANQTVCNGAPTAAVNFTGTVPGTVFSWTNNNTSIGLAASGTGNIASFTATNATNAAITATITVTPTFINGSTTCAGTPRTFTITVNPIPTVNTVANQSVCNGSATAAITFTGAVAGTVYNWTNNTPSIGLAASGTGNIASFTAVNTTNAPVTATITVTPTYTNGGTTCTGSPTTFTITVTPTTIITTNPVSQTLCEGGPVTFSVTATGTALTYQWQVNNGSGFVNIAGATASTYTINPATGAMNGNQYRVIVTGTCGTLTSTAATLTVNTAPAITGQPASAAACIGSNATFTVTATGTALTYQWQISTTGSGGPWTNLSNTAPYSGVTTATLTVSNVTAAMAGHQFRVIINGTCTPSITSNPASLSVNNPVVITTQPASVTICFGPNATFSVVATGTGLTYQWQVNNGSGFVNIPGAVNSTLTVNNPGPVNFLQYRVIVTGACGSVISNTATLIVFALPSISLAQVPPRVCLTDTIVTLKANVAGGVWTGRGVSGDKFNPAVAGLGASTITYTSTNANGCISVQSTTIVVNDCKERHNKLRDALRIYPNPSNGRFNIAFLSDLYKEFNLRVIDARGAVVKDFRFTGMTYGTVIPMNLTQLPAGMYILEAYNTQERAAFKIVITR